jgi:hypothetical protein
MKTSVSRVVNCLLFLLLPIWAWACDCAPIEGAAARADLIFVGRCIEVSSNPIKGDLNVVFQVDSSWKRSVEAFSTVHTPTTDCHYAFTKGRRYLIYANKFHQTLKTSICEPNTVLLDGEDPRLEGLGKAFAPGRPDFARKMNLILIGLGLGGLVFIGLVVMRKRIFKPRGGAKRPA